MQLRSTTGAAVALLLLASFLLPCFDFCPEEEGAERCPPVCTSCLGCPRSSVIAPAIGPQLISAAAAGTATIELAGPVLPILSDDIPHVPLAAAA